MLKEVVSTLRSHSNYHARILNAVETLVERKALSAHDRTTSEPGIAGTNQGNLLLDRWLPRPSLGLRISDPRFNKTFSKGEVSPPPKE